MCTCAMLLHVRKLMFLLSTTLTNSNSDLVKPNRVVETKTYVLALNV